MLQAQNKFNHNSKESLLNKNTFIDNPIKIMKKLLKILMIQS